MAYSKFSTDLLKRLPAAKCHSKDTLLAILRSTVHHQREGDTVAALVSDSTLLEWAFARLLRADQGSLPIDEFWRDLVKDHPQAGWRVTSFGGKVELLDKWAKVLFVDSTCIRLNVLPRWQARTEGGAWLDYPDDIRADLELARYHHRDRVKFTLSANQQSYTVHLLKNTQTNDRTKVVRTVRRLEVNIKTPTVWEYLKDGEWKKYDDQSVWELEERFTVDDDSKATLVRAGKQRTIRKRSDGSFCELGTGKLTTTKKVRRRIMRAEAAAHTLCELTRDPDTKDGRALYFVLRKPPNAQAVDDPESRLYLRAIGLFSSSMTSAKLPANTVQYVFNEELFERFETERQNLKKANGSEPTEMFVYHGTLGSNISSIVKSGFVAGGGTLPDGKKIPIANGAVHGNGIYTAVSPDVPLQTYGKGSTVILARALVGVRGTKSADKCDMWVPNDQPTWAVFRKSEQLLPVFVLVY